MLYSWRARPAHQSSMARSADVIDRWPLEKHQSAVGAVELKDAAAVWWSLVLRASRRKSILMYVQQSSWWWTASHLHTPLDGSSAPWRRSERCVTVSAGICWYVRCILVCRVSSGIYWYVWMPVCCDVCLYGWIVRVWGLPTQQLICVPELQSKWVEMIPLGLLPTTIVQPYSILLKPSWPLWTGNALLLRSSRCSTPRRPHDLLQRWLNKKRNTASENSFAENELFFFSHCRLIRSFLTPACDFSGTLK